MTDIPANAISFITSTHALFLGKSGEVFPKVIAESEWVTKSNITPGIIRRAYRENLGIVLDSIARLLDGIGAGSWYRPITTNSSANISGRLDSTNTAIRANSTTRNSSTYHGRLPSMGGTIGGNHRLAAVV